MLRRQSPCFRPQLECLEDRLMPSVMVTTTLDPTTPIAGQLSLREAINMVNAGQVADNTILLPAGNYQNVQGALNVTHSLILQGAGDANTILDGGNKDRVLLIDPAAAVNVQISGVTVRDGNANGPGGGIDVQDAAGQSSVLTVQNCIISGNTANSSISANYGGGIAVNNGDVNVLNCQVIDNQVSGAAGAGFGGGIADSNGGTGNITVSDSILAGNTAAGGGGIALVGGGPGSLTVTGSTVRDNSLTTIDAGGGGIFANTLGAVRISETTIQGNTSLTDGGGFAEQSNGPANILFSNDTIDDNLSLQGNGGGIAVETASNVTIQNSTISNNVAAGLGGGLLLNNLVLTAMLQDSTVSNNIAGSSGGGGVDEAAMLTATNSTFDGNDARNGNGGALDVNGANQTVTLSNDILRNNGAVGSGGALADNSAGSTLTVNNCLILNNAASLGGGLNASGGTAVVANSLFVNNAASASGGGIIQGAGTLSVRDSQFTGNVAGSEGGGLFSQGLLTFEVSGSTFNNNRAGTGGAVCSVSSIGTVPPPSMLTNDTFTGNTALDGAAIADGANDTLMVLNDTISGNTATPGGTGAGFYLFAFPVTVVFQNTIVAGNTASTDPDINASPVTDNGGNFIGNLTGSTGFKAGTLTGDPLLGPLANNGGPLAGVPGDQQVVQTEALLPGSPAIDKGVAMGAPTTDERGFTRPIGVGPDIGAFEFQNAALTVSVTPATPTVLVHGSEMFTVTVTNTSGNALPADNSTLAVTLSAGLTPTSPLTFTLGALAAGQSQTFTVTATATTLGTQTITAAVTSPDANPNTVSANVTVVTPPPAPPSAPPPSPPTTTTTHTPVGGLTLFAFGFGPTGIDLFEVDSVGDVFALPLQGGGAPLFLNTALHLPLAVLQDGQLLALLAGSNGQNYLIDILNPFSPLIEPTVIATLLHR
jgi:hypothetical protein